MRERLRALPLFAHLDEERLDALAAATTEFEASPGKLLIQHGAPGSGMFVLEEGRAVVEAPEGERELGPGDVFGERALVGESLGRTARVRAVTQVRCLAIGRSAIERLVAEDSRLADSLRQLSA